MNKIIELKNIVKNYDSKKRVKVLNKLNFSFNAGKIYSIMGPSGSGKSTLLNILSLIDTPTSGVLKIDSRTINYSSISSNDLLRAKKIGIIYQQNNLLNLNQPCTNWLRSNINDAVVNYFKSTLINYAIDWQIHAWPNINRLGDYHDPHNHPHSYLSGTYYLKIPSNPEIGRRPDNRPNHITLYDPFLVELYPVLNHDHI